MFNFNNHNVASSFSRQKSIRGGSLLLVNKDIKCKERKDIVSLSVERSIELSCAELDRFIVICVYRPPSADFRIFESIMEDALNRVFNSHKCIIVCGDFNINLLDDSNTSSCLLHLFRSFNLVNLFCEPTRITETSATCIDNIFCTKSPVGTNVFNKLGSDHCGQIASFSVEVDKLPSDIVFRPVTERRLKTFNNNIQSKLDFLRVPIEDPNDFYTKLFVCIENEFNACFKVKKVVRKNRARFSDWATPGIHKSRNNLYELYALRASHWDVDLNEYVKSYSKLFKQICIIAKSKHFARKIRDSKDKIKTVWKIIGSETGKVKSHDPKFSLLVCDKVIESDLEVANEFERFFRNIPLETTRSLNSSPPMAESLLKTNVPECSKIFCFKYVTPQMVTKAFRSLHLKKTEDLWGLSVKVLQSIMDPIAPHLASLFNRCVDAGVFPDLMKHSRVIPLFKSGSKSDPTNYRPVSILPAISKVFEKIILDQLLSHFNINNLLHGDQFGFTRGRSTIDAGTTVIKHICEAWEQSLDAIGVFCDLSKAFDCVDHDTLIRKLNHYGMKDKALDLVRSYLNDRTQRVDINKTKSAGSLISMGVPQGSILGPFLFLVYINDLPYVLNGKHKLVLFADDTSIIFKVKRNQGSFSEINNVLSSIVHWFTINNLLLNAKKTKCIRFSLPNVKHKNKTQIIIKDEVIELEDKTVFLGITLDSKLQWSPHISTLAGRLSSAAYAVKRIRQLADVETARLVYFAYFHSIMTYGILLWGKAAEIHSIFILQKRAIRNIYNLGSRVSLKDRFKEINVLTVASQYIYENIMYIRKNLDMYKLNSDVHNFNTRNKNKVAIPGYRLCKVNMSFMGNCVRFYNKLPSDILKLSMNRFKSSVKRHLIEKSYYTIKEFIDDKEAFICNIA
jgi:hypothetical protein